MLHSKLPKIKNKNKNKQKIIDFIEKKINNFIKKKIVIDFVEGDHFY